MELKLRAATMSCCLEHLLQVFMLVVVVSVIVMVIGSSGADADAGVGFLNAK